MVKNPITWLRIPTGRRRTIWLLKKQNWAKHLNTGLTRTIKQVDRVVLELGASPLHAQFNHPTTLPSPFRGNTV